MDLVDVVHNFLMLLVNFCNANAEFTAEDNEFSLSRFFVSHLFLRHRKILQHSVNILAQGCHPHDFGIYLG
jgi:hypothetical protein